MCGRWTHKSSDLPPWLERTTAVAPYEAAIETSEADWTPLTMIGSEVKDWGYKRADTAGRHERVMGQEGMGSERGRATNAKPGDIVPEAMDETEGSYQRRLTFIRKCRIVRTR